ncbi:MAG: hypothetical protein LC800_22305 [Acidobacteria bacterium]|nr:hypothetical protein [Acidobacteriota bacterium]
MRRRRRLALLIVLSLAGSSAAEQIEVRNVGELVKPADLIARVRILSTTGTGAADGYPGKVSLVSVTEAVRGAVRGQVVELEHSYVNVICPNVMYEVGEDVLLFATKRPGGRYGTLYADAGKIPIRHGLVERNPFKQGQSYASAMSEVRREVKKLSALAAARR